MADIPSSRLLVTEDNKISTDGHGDEASSPSTIKKEDGTGGNKKIRALIAHAHAATPVPFVFCKNTTRSSMYA